MRPLENVISLKGTRLRESEKAVQFSIMDISGTEIDPPNVQWFPLSQVKSSITSQHVGEDVLVVSEWICTQKELI